MKIIFPFPLNMLLVVFPSHILKTFFYPCKCIDVFVIDVEFESLALVNFLFIL